MALLATDAAAHHLRNRAIQVLRDTGIIRDHGRLHPLTDDEAKAAVDALMDAGLLSDPPVDYTQPAPVLTVERAGALDRLRKHEPRSARTIALYGAIRLFWDTSAFAYRVTGVASEPYRGESLADAVAAYNDAVAGLHAIVDQAPAPARAVRPARRVRPARSTRIGRRIPRV